MNEVYAAPLRAFLQAHYSDEKLAALLAHAEDGKLVYESCCCFVGIATADHALHVKNEFYFTEEHYSQALALPGGASADLAYCLLVKEMNIFFNINKKERNKYRRQQIIPLIREEMARREALRNVVEVESQCALVSL